MKNTGKLLLIFIVLFLAISCSKPSKAVFLIDTSGSMRTDDRISIVRKEAKNFLKRKIGGQTYCYVATFDINVKEIYEGKPSKDNMDILNSRIESLEAKGQWTYMEKALDYIKQNLDAQSDKRQVAYIFTDGLNDVPPGEVELDFYRLIDDKFKDWDKKFFKTFVIDLSNEPTKGKWDGGKIISFAGYYFTTYVLPLLLLVGGVLLILFIIGYRNKIVNNAENIKTISRLSGNEPNSPEEVSARINLNRNFIGQKRIDLTRDFPIVFDSLNKPLLVTVDKYNYKKMITKSGDKVRVYGSEYEEEPWSVEYDIVFAINDQHYIIK